MVETPISLPQSSSWRIGSWWTGRPRRAINTHASCTALKSLDSLLLSKCCAGSTCMEAGVTYSPNNPRSDLKRQSPCWHWPLGDGSLLMEKARETIHDIDYKLFPPAMLRARGPMKSIANRWNGSNVSISVRGRGLATFANRPCWMHSSI